jgi:hypothetical protein
MTELGARIRELGQRHALAPIVLGVVLYSTGPVFVRASSVSGPVFSFWRLWFGVGVFAAGAACGSGAVAGSTWRPAHGGGRCWPVSRSGCTSC